MTRVAPQTAKAMSEHWTARAHRFDGAASHLKQFDTWLNLFRQALGEKKLDVVDLGTGTGACALLCATLGHRVTAVDGASGMLDYARAQAKERGLDIRFIENTMDDADLPDACADIVTIRNVLWTLEQPEQTLRLAHRLLRPGGRILVSDGLWRTSPNTSADAFGAELPFVNGLSETEARAMLDRAGFGDITAWQHLLPNDLYGTMYDPGAQEMIRFFVLTARQRTA
ncbi:class I SAM-dependent methyltransferase [Tianweitania sp. BSSL-BM11]|uniref:Class I SAM-dependent methyltransferase n=1 Tax=Tianweitania aestuarii TaxID=2814886 RepID=A0ABS5RRJ6_9HYPH|nr:class I SAM-dependent methyltransferase [Tianweitania aestuarii]MBS9719587.1 class I SAM-dependent methyltransferase [Tianweitania aestuarii]